MSAAIKWNLVGGWWFAEAVSNDVPVRDRLKAPITEVYGIGTGEEEYRFGLGTESSPTVIASWDSKPWPQPKHGSEKIGDWIDQAGDFDDELRIGLEEGHDLVEACKVMGWNPASSEWCASWWLFDCMGKRIESEPKGSPIVKAKREKR